MDQGEPNGTVRTPLRAELLRERLVRPAGPLERLEVLATVGSTSTELARLVGADPGAWPAPALLLTDFQEAGRGRLDRSWQTPPYTALTGSALLRPKVPRERWTWLPLLSGLAVVRALRTLTGVAAGLKWPNDLLVPAPDGTEAFGWGVHRKVGGILSEVLPDGAVVVGIGLNVAQRADELPVPSASSLALAGARQCAKEDLVVAVAGELARLLRRWEDAGGDAERAGLRAEVEGVLVSRGLEVRAIVAGGREIRGVATALSPDGSLRIRTPRGERTVLSGDVHHVRTVDPV